MQTLDLAPLTAITNRVMEFSTWLAMMWRPRLTIEDVDRLSAHFKPDEHEFVRDRVYITREAIQQRLAEVDPAFQIVIDPTPHYLRDTVTVFGYAIVKGVKRWDAGTHDIRYTDQSMKDHLEALKGGSGYTFERAWTEPHNNVAETHVMRRGTFENYIPQPTPTTDPIKSAISDCYKRLGYAFHIGEYLRDPAVKKVKTYGDLSSFINAKFGTTYTYNGNPKDRTDPRRPHAANRQLPAPTEDQVTVNDRLVKWETVLNAKGDKILVKFTAHSGREVWYFSRSELVAAGLLSDEQVEAVGNGGTFEEPIKAVLIENKRPDGKLYYTLSEETVFPPVVINVNETEEALAQEQAEAPQSSTRKRR